jgi:hypothetical protein
MYYPFDTLTFYYSRKLQFLSNACGYTDFYNIDSLHYTNLAKDSLSNIDSIQNTNRRVTNNVNTKHLKIYIHRNF